MTSPENFDSIKNSTYESSYKPYIPSNRDAFSKINDQFDKREFDQDLDKYDSNRPLPVQSQFKNMFDDDNFLNDLQNHFPQDNIQNLRQRNTQPTYHQTQPNDFDNPKYQPNLHHDENMRLQTEPIMLNNSKVINATPAKTEQDLDEKLKKAELEMELQNRDQDDYQESSLSFKLTHPNWRIRKNALFQIKLIIESWLGVSQEQLEFWFEKSTSTIRNELDDIARRESKAELYSQNWRNSPKLEYFKSKFEKFILNIVKEKNIALLDEGLQTILSFLYMPREIAYFCDLESPSMDQILMETPINKDIFTKMLVLLMNMQPNKKYEGHLNEIFKFALGKESYLITSHIINKCQDKNVSVKLNSLKILFLLLNTQKYAGNKELLIDIVNSLLNKKSKWAVKCRELVCKNLNLSLKYFHGNKHEYLKHFFPFIYKERKVLDQYKWVDIGVKDPEKFENIELVRFKKKVARPVKEEEKEVSENQELSESASNDEDFEEKKLDVLTVPDTFINLMYENNLQKKKDIIEKFLSILNKFKESNKRILCNENTIKSIENAFRVNIELVEESNLMFYLPGLKIGQIMFELLPPKSIHKILIKQFITHSINKFNLKQNINVIVKQCFDLIVSRKFLSLEIILKIALNFIYKSKFLNVKEFGLDWLSSRFVKKFSFHHFKESFISKLEPTFCDGNSFGGKLKRGMSSSKSRLSSVKKTFSSRNTSYRKKSQKNSKMNISMDIVSVVLRILEHFKSSETNMKTHKLISKYIKVYIENQNKRTISNFYQNEPIIKPNHRRTHDRFEPQPIVKKTKSSRRSKKETTVEMEDYKEEDIRPKESLMMNPVDLFLEKIENIHDMNSFKDFVNFYQMSPINGLIKKVKFKVVSQKMEFIFREVAAKLGPGSRLLLSFINIFIRILSSTEKEKLFVLTITFIGLNDSCDFSIFDVLYDSVKRPFKCYNFSNSIIKENFEKEDVDLFNQNVTRYFKNKLEASLIKQTIFFKNHLSFIIQSVLVNCLDSQYQEEYVSFLEKCYHAYSEELLIEVISNFIKNDPSLMNFGIELVKSFQNKFENTQNLNISNDYETNDINLSTQNLESEQFESNNNYLNERESNLEYLENRDTINGEDVIQNGNEEDTLKQMDEPLKNDQYPTVSEMQAMLESKRKIGVQLKEYDSFKPKRMEPHLDVRKTIEVEDIKDIKLNAHSKLMENSSKNSQYASPDLKNLNGSPNYKMQRLQHLKNKRDQRLQYSKSNFQDNETVQPRVKRTKDFIIKTSNINQFNSNPSKNYNEIETEKQYNKYKTDKEERNENQLQEFQSVHKIKMFTMNKEVQTDERMNQDKEREMTLIKQQLEDLENENNELKSMLEESEKEKSFFQKKLNEVESTHPSMHSISRPNEQFQDLSIDSIYLFIFNENQSNDNSDQLFRVYTSSDKQDRKDFLLSLKDILIDKRLIYSVSRTNLMMIINFILKVSISLSTNSYSMEIEKKLSGVLIDKILNSKPHFEMISILLELIKKTIPNFETKISQSTYLLIKFYLNCSQRFLQISEKIDCFNFLRIVGELFDERPPELLNDQVVSLEIFDEIFRSLRSMSDQVIRKNVECSKLFYQIYKQKLRNQVFINYVSNYLVSIE